jgi:hypothetical protein
MVVVVVGSTNPVKITYLILLLALIFSSFVVAQTEDEITTESSECDGCRFFPTVCDNIDFCINKCNIAPSMRASCTEL